MVVYAEQAVEQLAAGGKARGRVGHKEHHDHQCCQAVEQIFFIVKTLGEEIRHGDSANVAGIAAQTARHHQPVEPCAERQADHRPCNIAQAGKIGKAGQAHQQVAAHIRSLGAHGRYKRPQLAAAQIKIACRFILLRVEKPDKQHTDQVYYNGCSNTEIDGSQNKLSFLFRHAPLFTLQRKPEIPCRLYHTFL